MAASLLFVFAALSRAADVNYKDIFIGKWNISVVELDDEGNEKPDRGIYAVEMASTGESGRVSGEVFGEDEEGVPMPVGKIGVELEEGTNSTFAFQLSENPEAEELDELAKFTLEMGIDDVCVTTGKTSDGWLYSVNVLSIYLIEVTLYNKESKAVTIIRCMKDAPPPQRGSMWTALMPMLPTLLFTLFGRGNMMGESPACEPGKGTPAGDKKND